VTWILKSIALSIEKGDDNTKYFHQFSNHRKNDNTIWKMKDPNGNISSSFKDLENGGVEHFKRIFDEDNRTSIVEVVIQATYFPRFITEKDNARIMRKVSKEELQYVFHSF
jgi:hypothetical protein